MRVRRKSFKTIKAILASAETAVKGRIAAVDTTDGSLYDCDTASTTFLPIGRFAEDLATGDGSTYVKVDLFEEVWAHGFVNDDAPNAVAAAHLWQEVYIKNSTTVSTSSASSTRSVAGRVIAIEGDYVFIQAGVAVTGPSGEGTNYSAGVATKAALAAITAANRYEGMLVQVQADRTLWTFDADGTASEDEANDLIIEPDAGDGQWVAVDKAKVLKIPISYANTDGEAIFTVPAGFVLRLAAFPYWEVTTGFTGGSSSTIGISTSVTGYTTAGDILGGASGDAAATLVAGDAIPGTVGDELDLAGFHALALVEDDELQYDRITSAFTAGAGYVHVPVMIQRV